MPNASLPVHDAAATLWAARSLTLGSVGIVVTSALYAAAPPRVALPMPGPAIAEALRDAAAGGALVVAAGSVGVLSDLFLIAGALMLAVHRHPTAHGLEPVGWTLVAIATLIFVGVDALAAGVLIPLATMGGAEAAFAGFKHTFDILFVVGTLAFGFGAWPILVSGRREGATLSPPLYWAGLGFASAAVVAGLLYFAHVNLAQVIGLSIAGGALVFALYGRRLAQRALGGQR
jgi:hypothetical protein